MRPFAGPASAQESIGSAHWHLACAGLLQVQHHAVLLELHALHAQRLPVAPCGCAARRARLCEFHTPQVAEMLHKAVMQVIV